MAYHSWELVLVTRDEVLRARGGHRAREVTSPVRWKISVWGPSPGRDHKPCQTRSETKSRCKSSRLCWRQPRTPSLPAAVLGCTRGLWVGPTLAAWTLCRAGFSLPLVQAQSPHWEGPPSLLGSKDLSSRQPAYSGAVPSSYPHPRFPGCGSLRCLQGLAGPETPACLKTLPENLA